MKNRIRLEWTIVTAGILVVLSLTLVTSSYYQNILKQVGEDGGEDGNECRYHYAMIVRDSDMPFQKDMYESTREATREHNALVESMGKSLPSTIETESLVDMAIASGVDGIVLEYTGGHRIGERINEADRAGTPVVTALKDAPDTSRISFVGVNDYQLKWQYGEQIFKLVPPDKDDVEVTLLFHGRDNSSQEQIAGQINSLLVTSLNTSGRVRLIQETMRFTGKVDADETIKSILFRKEGIPDILVCTEAVDTEAAHQAMVDYNKVGELQLLGYYESGQILGAVRKGNILVMLVIDTERMGRYYVQALEECLQEGRANSYYSVDLQFITKGNVSQLMKHGR